MTGRETNAEILAFSGTGGRRVRSHSVRYRWNRDDGGEPGQLRDSVDPWRIDSVRGSYVEGRSGKNRDSDGASQAGREAG